MKQGISMALALMATPSLAQTSPGIAYLSDIAAQERPLALSIWYPSDEEGSVTVGGNAVFMGASAAPNAVMPTGPLPLIVLSHGGLRSATNSGAWLSASLAQAGYIVVEVNAPRPESAAIALNEIWQRPQDVSRVVDLMLGQRDWAGRIDQDRMYVVGFALGGTAALSLAGEKIDAERYLQSCAGEGDTSGPDCAWYAAHGGHLAQTDRAGLMRPMWDPRFISAVAIAPEYLAAFVDAQTRVATLLVTLGDVEQKAVEGQYSRSVLISEAVSSDAFAACTEAGPAILLEEDGDASICGASPDAREKIQREIIEAITAFFAKNDN